MTTSYIKFESADFQAAKGVGSISTLAFDTGITVEPVACDNPMAPTNRVVDLLNLAGSGRSRTVTPVPTNSR